MPFFVEVNLADLGILCGTYADILSCMLPYKLLTLYLAIYLTVYLAIYLTFYLT